MKHYWMQKLQAVMVCTLLATMASGSIGATDTISGRVIMLTVSGRAYQDITTPYVSGVFALVDVQLWNAATTSGHMPASYILDTAVERVMLLGLLSKLSIGESASLSGEVEVNVCLGDRMDPITSVRFN